MNSKEMFKKLNYEYYEDDGFDVFTKVDVLDDYILYKKISFNRLNQEVSVYTYKKDKLLGVFIENGSLMKMNFLCLEEVKAINKYYEEHYRNYK